MKIERSDGASPGKYAVVKLRDMAAPEGWASLGQLAAGGFVRFERPGDADEFMVLFLKDRYAAAALSAYADAAEADGYGDYANQVRDLVLRAGPNSPFCKRPD